MTITQSAQDGDVAFAARLPSVERILADASCTPLIEQYGRTQTLAALRTLLGEVRAEMVIGAAREDASKGAASKDAPAPDGIPGLNAILAERLARTAVSPLKQVF